MTRLPLPLIAIVVLAGCGDDVSPGPDARPSDGSGGVDVLPGEDTGMVGTGRILFADDFESGNLDAWDEVGGEAGKYVIVGDPALVHTGAGALDITIRTDWSSGQLNKWFEAVDEVHISMDVMFSAGWDQSGVTSRHLMQLSGNNVNVMRWGPYPDSSFGRAGETPDGTDFFWIHLTPWNDDAWHVGMAHPDQSSMWGDSIQTEVLTSPGTYQHVVLHGRLNALGSSDGFVRLYVDGAMALDHAGLEFRTSDELVFNSAGFQAYYQAFTGSGHVYVDNFVVREGPPAL